MLTYDVECGLHSGIPPCCVLWYAAECREAIMQAHADGNRVAMRRFDAYRDKVDRVAARRGIRGWGYVPCPLCLRSGRVVRLRRCPTGPRMHSRIRSWLAPVGRAIR
jgi:hypothetical protein